MVGAWSRGPRDHLVEQGNVFAMWKLDRLGRSLSHLIEVVDSLKEKNVAFKSLTEALDTTTASGELLFQVFDALAQFERALISERVTAGLEAARSRGRIDGRPRAISPEKLDAILEALDSGISKATVCRTFGVKRSSLIETLKRLRSRKRTSRTYDGLIHQELDAALLLCKYSRTKALVEAHDYT